jgi:hypothetical protein
MMNGYKTILGSLIAATPAFANLMGFDVAPGFGEEATAILMDVITIVGVAIAIYGRLVAQAPGWFAKK